MKNFTKDHFAMVIKYLGVSFITGALSHGFFSGPRATGFAIAGILLFVIGSVLGKKDDKNNSSFSVLLYSSLLAVSIGAFAGGAQHFTDSPERSLFITPIGFSLSLLFYFLLEKITLTQKDWLYAIGSSVLVAVSSYLFFLAIPMFGLATMGGGHGGHGNDGGHGEISSHSETEEVKIDHSSSAVNIQVPVMENQNITETQMAVPTQMVESHANDGHGNDGH